MTSSMSAMTRRGAADVEARLSAENTSLCQSVYAVCERVSRLEARSARPFLRSRQLMNACRNV